MTRPDWADFAPDPRDAFWDEQSHYPRGSAPPWGGDDAPSESVWGNIYTDDEHPDPYGDLIHDPGFPEHEVDDHPDPDHGREDHRTGAILRQSEQFPWRMAAGDPDDYGHDDGGNNHYYDINKIQHHYDDYGPEENDWEHQRAHEGNIHDPSTQEAWQAHVMKDKDTGLGYDVLVKRNPKGDGWDVIRPIE